MIYDMVGADVSSTAIIHAARWKSPAMLVRYTRYLETARGAVAQLYAGRPLVMRKVRRWRLTVVVRCPDGPEHTHKVCNSKKEEDYMSEKSENSPQITAEERRRIEEISSHCEGHFDAESLRPRGGEALILARRPR